jgi:N4-gp56 family major capsid protein
MADITISAATPNETEKVQLWQRKLWHTVYYENFWQKNGFIAENGGGIIHLKKDFSKEKGSVINFGLRVDPTTAPIAGEGWVEGNEMQYSEYNDSVLLDMASGAERTNGPLTEQRASYDVRAEMKDSLANWWNYQLTEWIFKKLTGQTYQGYAGTANGTLGSLTTIGEAGVANTAVLYGGDASATTDIDESDKLSTGVISIAKLCAKSGYIGSTAIYKMRPVMINGKGYYVLIAHPYALYDLKQSAAWEQAMREAEMRGPENPLFTGATALWDGVIIYEHDQVPITTTGGVNGDVPYAHNCFLGAQAALMAVAQDGPNWVEELFNYNRKWGVATGMMMGIDKAMFNSKDFATIVIRSAAKHPKA